jgi:hypothetical protein
MRCLCYSLKGQRVHALGTTQGNEETCGRNDLLATLSDDSDLADCSPSCCIQKGQPSIVILVNQVAAALHCSKPRLTLVVLRSQSITLSQHLQHTTRTRAVTSAVTQGCQCTTAIAALICRAPSFRIAQTAQHTALNWKRSSEQMQQHQHPWKRHARPGSSCMYRTLAPNGYDSRKCDCTYRLL